VELINSVWLKTESGIITEPTITYLKLHPSIGVYESRTVSFVSRHTVMGCVTQKAGTPQHGEYTKKMWLHAFVASQSWDTNDHNFVLFSFFNLPYFTHFSNLAINHQHVHTWSSWNLTHVISSLMHISVPILFQSRFTKFRDAPIMPE